MSTVRIRRRLESETLTIPELKEMLGKEVDIVIEEVPVAQGDLSEFFEAAKNPPVDLDAIEELRETR